MKLKILLLCISCLGFFTSMAARDVISSTRVSNSYGISIPSQNSINRAFYAPVSSAVNITIKDETSNPELLPAINLAKQYLGEVIKEDFPITILIKYGTIADFSGTYGTAELLAITTSHYVLNNFENRNPSTQNSNDRLTGGEDTLIPEALANRQYLGDTDPSSEDITILLHPQIPFFTGTDYTQISESEYDLVTVLLREMVTGCGFASSFTFSESPLFSSMKQASNSVYYPVLFDRGLYNNDNFYFNTIPHDENNELNIHLFLLGKSLYFDGSLLYNDVSSEEIQNGITLNTTNRTYDPNEDPNNPDLMTWNYRIGKSSVIRKITPKTAAILNNLGWDIDIATGYSSAFLKIINKENSGFIIYPGQYYNFEGQIPTGSSTIYDIMSFSLELVKKNGDHYVYETGVPYINLLPINYNISDLPANEEWQRDPETGYIIGYLKLNGMCYSNGITSVLSGLQRVLLPLSPLNVSIAATKQNVAATSMDAKVTYDSSGATSYNINYIAYGSASGNTITVSNKEQVAYILSNLDPTKRYSIYVKAINSAGSATSETVTIGSVYTTASCVFTKTGTTAKYQIKVGETIMNDLVVTSAAIYNSSGVLKMNVTTTPNESFSIASLTSGVYILKVMVKDYGQCSKIFLR